MGDGSGALWFGAPGFEVLDVAVSDAELIVEVQTTATGQGPPVGERVRRPRW